MANPKKRKATRSRAATASASSAQKRIAELGRRIDAAPWLDERALPRALSEERVARAFLAGAAQAIRDGDAARAFLCGVEVRELLVRPEAAESVRRGTHNDVQAIALENRDDARNRGAKQGRRKRGEAIASRNAALIKKAKKLRAQHDWTAKRIGEELAFGDAQQRSAIRIARIIGRALSLPRGRPVMRRVASHSTH